MIIEILSYIYIIPAALGTIVLHELGHAFVSYWLGDPTPEMQGRLTLNPLKHLDIVGTISLIIFGFGWAKPVQVDPTYYKNPKRDITLVSLAGPLVNFILTIASFIIIATLIKINQILINNVINSFIVFFMIVARINIGLGLFNLLPIPPLDGSKIISVFIPQRYYYNYMSYQRYGNYFMIALMIIIFTLNYVGFPSPITWVTDKIFYFFFNLII